MGKVKRTLEDAMDELRSALGRHPFFKEAPERVLTAALGHAQSADWEAGEVIFRKGGAARWVYLIRRGRVAVEMPGADGGERIDWVRGGEVLGWSWFVPPYRWRFDARAQSATRAIALPAAWVRAQCRRVPALGNAVMKQTAGIILQRWTAAAKRVLDSDR